MITEFGPIMGCTKGIASSLEGVLTQYRITSHGPASAGSSVNSASRTLNWPGSTESTASPCSFNAWRWLPLAMKHTGSPARASSPPK